MTDQYVASTRKAHACRLCNVPLPKGSPAFTGTERVGFRGSRWHEHVGCHNDRVEQEREHRWHQEAMDDAEGFQSW